MTTTNQSQTIAVLTVIALLALAIGCGDSATGTTGWEISEEEGGKTSYGDDGDSIVTSNSRDDTFVVTGQPEEDECVEIEEHCYDLEDLKDQYCDDRDAQVDVIVVDGEVVDVICYPPRDGGQDIEEITRDEDGDAEVEQTNNGAVVTFDESTDGEPIEGDITMEAERVTLFGNGVDETIIDGDIYVRSNQSRIRGVTIMGDVTFEQISNNSKMAFCKIYGDLLIESNEVTVTNCQVWGDVTVTGNNTTLVNIGVQGAWEISPNSFCDGCYRFTDEEDDKEVHEDEIGEELTCGDDDGGETEGGETEGGEEQGGGGPPTDIPDPTEDDDEGDDEGDDEEEEEEEEE